MATSWSYSTSAKRFRDDATGRFLSEKAVVSIRDQIVTAANLRTSALAKQLAAGTITPSDFAAEMRKTVKTVYTTQYQLGRGGTNAMTASDRGVIGRALRDQYGFLDRFQRDLEAALRDGPLEADPIATRAALYVENGIAMHERAQAVAHDLIPPLFPPRHPRCACWWSYGTDDKGPFAVWHLGDRPCPICGAIEAQYGADSPYRGDVAA